MANQFERKEKYEINEVLDHLPNPNDYPKEVKLKTIKTEYAGDMIKMGLNTVNLFSDQT